jgi:hypothetical protein
MKRRQLLLLPLFWQMLNVAQAQDEALGRLFFTPTQRAALDRQRQLNPDLRGKPESTAASLTLNGTVHRSSGHNTHWVNGEADWNGTTLAPKVPVGDTYHPESGDRDRLLGNGRIIVNRSSRRQ